MPLDSIGAERSQHTLGSVWPATSRGWLALELLRQKNGGGSVRGERARAGCPLNTEQLRRQTSLDVAGRARMIQRSEGLALLVGLLRCSSHRWMSSSDDWPLGSPPSSLQKNMRKGIKGKKKKS